MCPSYFKEREVEMALRYVFMDGVITHLLLKRKSNFAVGFDFSDVSWPYNNASER